MTRRIRTSPVAHSLPKVSFEKVEDEVSTQPGGVHDQQARSYGYNDFSEFHMPDHYIRHIEPLESDLARQVEYDMDEQDQEWLDQVNADRKKEQLDKVSYEAFEIIMDRLEKEWFDLTKNIPKPDLAMPSEDSTCAVCDDSEGENSNAIVFCDGCNLAVHQDCYGVPYIPEGQWLCRKCTVSPEVPVQCILCPNEGGAFKQTVHGEWVHLLCAIWVPETRVANEVFMEPITGVEKISKQRWKLKCNICDIRQGACIQCAKTSCFLAFHATCARKEKLLLPMKSTQGAEPAALTCYCERHLSREQAEARATALAAEEAHSGTLNHNQTSKSARAYAKTYKPGPPLVPALIVNRILTYIGKVSMRKKQEFLWMVCRYWSLKREARRGAPLLKRLHLEPWTASAGGKIQTDEEKRMKLEQLLRLREDLIKVRSLAELCRKRETRKYRQAEIIHKILSQSLFLHEEHLRMVFERITSIDRQDYFKNPVSKIEVPDYFDIIKNPMCWSFIEAKLDKHEYWDVKAFKNDIDLVVDNAITYNKTGTPFHRTALRIRNASEAILGELDQWTRRTGHSEFVNDENGAGGSASTRQTIGDLEPPIEILELLVSTDAIKPSLNIELDHDPIMSLFNYEFARMKPPPTPPPPPPPKARKPKRDRKAEYERAKAKKEATGALPIAVGSITGNLFAVEPNLTEEHFVNVEASTSLLAPRTRRALAAAAAAFESDPYGEGLQSAAAHGAGQVPIQEPEESDSISFNARRKRRASLPLPGLSGGPQVVDNVDSRSAFRMFNDGWILPSDQKRGGRQNVDRQVLPPPPPRKRERTDTATSRLSTFSTSASENRTLAQSPSASLSRSEAPMDVDSELPSSISVRFSSSGPIASLRPGAKDEIIPPGNIVQGPNGTLVIERLDTPAIRRQKNLLRKAEKQRLMTTTISESTSLPALHASLSKAPSSPGMLTEFPESSSRNEAGPSSSNQRATKLEAPEIESELSSLSEFGSEEVMNQKLAQSKPAPPEPVLSFSEAPVLVGVPKSGPRPLELEAGTLVWAKSNSFPWWPAVIHEETDLGVPPVLREKCQQARAKHKRIPIVVQFFDKTQSWQVLPPDKLKLLGEDKAVDDELNKQKFKSDAQREECQSAYLEAIAAIDVDSDHDELERNISQF